METDFILYLLTVKCILSAQRVTETQEPHCKVQVWLRVFTDKKNYTHIMQFISRLLAIHWKLHPVLLGMDFCPYYLFTKYLYYQI